MSHGVGVVEVVQSVLGPVIPVFAVVTQLADVWFLLLLLSTLYLANGSVPGVRDRIDRQQVAYVIALTIGALALTVGTKLLVGLSRPPGAGTPVGGEWLPGPLFDIYARAAVADGYGFPSGHAIGSTVVYGGLALVYGDSISRRRLLLAGGLAALIGFSRIALGVHHLTSVLAGFALGVAYLAVMTKLTDNGRRVGLAFLLAVFASVFALFGGGYAREPVLAFGMALGGRLTWQVSGERIGVASTDRRTALLSLAIGLPVVGGLFAIIEVLELAIPATLLLSGVIVTALLVLPVVVGERKR